jgi:hypothetical protein
MILAAWFLLLCKRLYHVDKGFHDFAVGSLARRSILEPFQRAFFRETLENFVTIQSWRIQRGIFSRKPAQLAPYDGLIPGWCLGWFSGKNVP